VLAEPSLEIKFIDIKNQQWPCSKSLEFSIEFWNFEIQYIGIVSDISLY